MKQQNENSFYPEIDRLIQDDQIKDAAPFLYTRIMQKIKNSHKPEVPLLPPLLGRFVIASIVILLSFNLVLLLNAPDCSRPEEPVEGAQTKVESPYEKGLDYDNITDILLNQ